MIWGRGPARFVEVPTQFGDDSFGSHLDAKPSQYIDLVIGLSRLPSILTPACATPGQRSRFMRW
jgi:hypothetical protein